MKRRALSLFTTILLIFSLCVPAFAAVNDTGFSDVAADAWYADAVMYVRNNGIMNGTSVTTFSPNATMTRAMLAAVLYRAAGSPAVSGKANFRDVAANAYYADAAAWASANGIVTGYGNGLFGSNDPVTREQIAAILWRYQGSPAPAGTAQRFADQSAVSNYAVSAVAWARENGIINGMEGNRFAPKNNATRAQVATILRNFLTKETPSTPDKGGKILIAYFTVPETSGVDAVSSASRVVDNGEVVGNVEFIARTIQEQTGGDLFQIETVQTYPGTHQELLDFAAAEGAANARPALSSRISNLDEYDVIFLGYPIWNADLPMPLYTFLDTYDLSGKTVIPFTAHGGSGFAGTISTIATQEPGAKVERSGFSVSRNSVAEARNDIIDWVDQLGYAKTQPAQPTPPTAAEPKVLVAYVSNTGTTKGVAQTIAGHLNADLAEIRRTTPYRDLQSEAKNDIDSGAQPAITVEVDDISQYDVIFVGYPIWWNEAPAMISTFLAENNFSGKIVAPFCTSASSSIDNSLHIFRELAPSAVLSDGLTANGPATSILSWADAVLASAA